MLINMNHEPITISFNQELVITLILIISFFVFRQIRKLAKESRKQVEQEENEFNMKYLWIQDRIKVLPVTLENYKLIMYHFCDMAQMKYRNKEKTQVLFKTFLDKFHEMAKYSIEHE